MSLSSTGRDYSQRGEQAIILGYFDSTGWPDSWPLVVDVGAYDGVTFSNSRALLDVCGWKGILVEPAPDAYALACLHSRSLDVLALNVAIVPELERETVTLHWVPGQPLSTVLGGRRGDAVELPGVGALDVRRFALAVGRTVEFLSLDTEGSELDLLASLLDYLEPRLVCVEAPPELALDVAGPRGYRVHAVTTLDDGTPLNTFLTR